VSMLLCRQVFSQKGRVTRNRFSAIVIFVFFATGCATMTPSPYAVSVENSRALKKYSGQVIRMESMVSHANYNPYCRLVASISAPDGVGIPQFIQNAFNDELRFAGSHSEGGISLFGTLDKIQFSSGPLLHHRSGWWNLGLTLKSNNGRTLSIESHHEFRSAFDPRTACNQTAVALVAAVQNLLNKTFNDPAFRELLQ